MNTPIEKGKEIPSKKNIPIIIDRPAAIIPMANDSLHKLKKIENLENPIACRLPNSLIRDEKAAKSVLRPPKKAPIDIKNAEIHVIHRIGA